MTLKVIGAGFGRTGTLSLKFALETLGFGPCYHMREVRENPDHTALWAQAVDGQTVDWRAMFTRYRAAVDWPVAAFWPQLIQTYPQAKVILTTRDPDDWFRSMHNTIVTSLRGPMPESPELRGQRLVNRNLILRFVFGGRIDDRDYALKVYHDNIAAVREQLPPERVLEFSPNDGWESLCNFLDVAVPDQPYPNVNSSAEFKRRWAEREEKSQSGGSEEPR